MLKRIFVILILTTIFVLNNFMSIHKVENKDSEYQIKLMTDIHKIDPMSDIHKIKVMQDTYQISNKDPNYSMTAMAQVHKINNAQKVHTIRIADNHKIDVMDQVHNIIIKVKDHVINTLSSIHDMFLVEDIAIAGEPPGIVTLLTPLDDSENISLTPTMTWEAADNADTYILRIYDDTEILIYEIEDIEELTYDVPEDTLDFETDYYWNITAINEFGESESSNFDFKTKIMECHVYGTGTTYIYFAPRYRALISFDILGVVNPSGTLTYRLIEPYSYLCVSTSILTVAVDDINYIATVTGTCTINSLPGYTFWIEIYSNPPLTNGQYRIILYNPDLSIKYDSGYRVIAPTGSFTIEVY